MSNFFIKLGEFKKILLLPFSLALTQILLLVLDDIIHEKVKNHVLESTSMGLGKLAIIIIPHIKFFSISKKEEEKKCECSKKNVLHYIILVVLYTITFNITYIVYEKNNYSIFWIKTENIATQQGIEILMITVISIFLLKYKYFIHHYISIILFCISSVGFDLLIDNYKKQFSNIAYYQYILFFASFLTEGAYFCFIKYMIDRHYHYYWNIMFAVGIMVLLACTVSIITTVIIKDSNLPNIENFMNYFKEVSYKIIIPKFILNTLLQFAYSLLEILTIFYLTPEYILITQNLSKIYILIYMLINYNKYLSSFNSYQYCYILFNILQIFSLMIYLEIFELNFCNLNKNTKRSIRLRTDDDLTERMGSIGGNSFESKEGYIFKYKDDNSCDDNNIKIELNQIKDDNNNYEHNDS